MNDDVKKFEAAARKTQRAITALDTVAVDEASNVRDLSAPISKMVDRLYTLANKAAYVEGSDARVGMISMLIQSSGAARERLQARIVSVRCAKIRELEIERARAANARPY